MNAFNAEKRKYRGVFFTAMLIMAGFSFGAGIAEAAFDVTISTDGNGTISGIVSGLPPTMIPATTNAVVNVPDGKSANFIFHAVSSYRVSDVLVDSVSIGAPLNYLFQSSTTGAPTLEVHFAPIAPYTISASAGAHGAVNPSGTISVEVSNSQAFSITPGAGFSIADVLVDSVSQGSVSSYTFPPFPAGTTDHTISAAFSQNTYTVTASAGANGSITPSGNISIGGTNAQAFSIVPNLGYGIADVLVDGVSKGAVSSYTFPNVVANHTITASFAVIPPAPITHIITVSAGTNGSVNPSGAVVVNAGADQLFIIAPDSGYHIEDVLVDDGSVGAVASYTFTGVSADHTISVIFEADQPQPASGGGGGGGTANNGWYTPPSSYSTPSATTSAQIVLALATPIPVPVVAEVPETPPAPVFVFANALSFGTRGDEVVELQRRLIDEGLLSIAEPTGYFGPLTETAVKAYQAKYGIIQTGFVGPLTLAELNEPIGHTASAPAMAAAVSEEAQTETQNEIASGDVAAPAGAETNAAVVIDANIPARNALQSAAIAVAQSINTALGAAMKIASSIFSFWK